MARRLLNLPSGLPFGVVFRALGSVDRPREAAINAVLWLGVGVLAAWSTSGADATVLFAGDRLRIRMRARELTLQWSEVADVFLDAGLLVVLDPASRQRVRVRAQAAPGTLRQAFLDHGYPWRARDPYATAFRRWEPADGVAPELPPGAAELLDLRQARLRRRAEAEADLEAESVRAALEELGVVVRDERRLQFWRPLASVRHPDPDPGPDPPGQP